MWELSIVAKLFALVISDSCQLLPIMPNGCGIYIVPRSWHIPQEIWRTLLVKGVPEGQTMISADLNSDLSSHYAINAL